MTRKTFLWFAATGVAVALAAAVPQAGQRPAPAPAAPAAGKVNPRVATLKSQVMADVNGMYDFGQVMTDMVFSYGELGFQEFETQKYLGGILKENGFTVETGVAGIPSAWVAKWGSGQPVIALGSDVDCIPQASQKPGVAYRDPIVDGAPATAKATIPARRSTSSPPSPSSKSWSARSCRARS